MKQLLILLSLMLISSCSGPSSRPFGYEDNSRIVIEGFLQTENGATLNAQKVELHSTSLGRDVVVKTIFSNSNGKIFISVPRGNYAYVIQFLGKKIVTMERYSELIYLNSSQQNTGILKNLNDTYYDLGIVKLINN